MHNMSISARTGRCFVNEIVYCTAHKSNCVREGIGGLHGPARFDDLWYPFFKYNRETKSFIVESLMDKTSPLDTSHQFSHLRAFRKCPETQKTR